MSEEEAPTPPYGLCWAIKRSFVDYVRRMPDGRGAVGEGAFPVGTHEIVYPPESAGRRAGPDGVPERFWTFHGDVRFTGHFGMLSVRIALPRIDLRGDRAELSIADPGAPDGRLPLVTLRLAPVPTTTGYELWVSADVTLTQEGSALFNDVYPEGEPFEDLLVALPFVPAAD